MSYALSLLFAIFILFYLAMIVFYFRKKRRPLILDAPITALPKGEFQETHQTLKTHEALKTEVSANTKVFDRSAISLFRAQ